MAEEKGEKPEQDIEKEREGAQAGDAGDGRAVVSCGREREQLELHGEGAG